MTDRTHSRPAYGARHPVLAALLAWLERQRRDRRRNRTAQLLADLDAHLLRDLGIEPMDVEASLAGNHYGNWFKPIRAQSEHE